MKRVVVFLGIALLVMPLVASRASVPDETKWVKGTVTAVASDSVTVKVRDKEMKFAVDNTTTVIAAGAGTKAAAAQKAGMAGPKLTDVVKTGSGVQVTYHEMGATMHAAEIRAGIDAGAGSTSEDAAAEATKRARGKVTAVAAGSITIDASGKSMMFSVDAKTQVVATGASTKTAAAKKQGEMIAITDLIMNGDQVEVSYQEMGGASKATQVRKLSR